MPMIFIVKQMTQPKTNHNLNPNPEWEELSTSTGGKVNKTVLASMRKMRQEGYTNVAIAQRFGLNDSTIRRHLGRLKK